MAEAIARLTRVVVPPHIRVRDGQVQHVDGYVYERKGGRSPLEVLEGKVPKGPRLLFESPRTPVAGVEVPDSPYSAAGSELRPWFDSGSVWAPRLRKLTTEQLRSIVESEDGEFKDDGTWSSREEFESYMDAYRSDLFVRTVATAEYQGRLTGEPPDDLYRFLDGDQAEVEQAVRFRVDEWTRAGVEEVPAETRRLVAESADRVFSSPELREVVKRVGLPRIVVAQRRADGTPPPLAEYFSGHGTIVVYAGQEGLRFVSDAWEPRPGVQVNGVWPDGRVSLDAVLRHEYGHMVADHLDLSRNAIPGEFMALYEVNRAQGAGVPWPTRYSRSSAQEAFAEGFSILTSPGYDPQRFEGHGRWLPEAVRPYLEKLGGKVAEHGGVR